MLTSRQFENIVKDAFAKRNKALWDDVFVVPDYKAYFTPSMGGIARFAKEELTQLQWIFEAVDKSSDYPLGVVKT